MSHTFCEITETPDHGHGEAERMSFAGHRSRHNRYVGRHLCQLALRLQEE
jgi:hypothetical protein